MKQQADPLYNFGDRSKMRGFWKAMLDNAAGADESMNIRHSLIVCSQIRRHQEYFPCLDPCKKDFGSYLANHPPELEIYTRDGLFDWVLTFRNHVSMKIGSPILDTKIMYDMFHNPHTNYARYKDTPYDFTDMAKMKGFWKALLDNAAGADESGDINHSLVVCSQIYRHCEYFPNKRLLGTYVNKSPPDREIHKKDGLFLWVVGFSNFVSGNIGAAPMDSSILYPMFRGNPETGACALQCKGNGDDNAKKTPGNVTLIRKSATRRDDASKNYIL